MVKTHGFNNGHSEVIPAEWQIKPLGDLFEFSGGYSASRDQLSETGHYYLHYGDIHGSNKSWIDTELDRQNIPKLDISLNNISGVSLLEDGDVVFVDASEDDDGTSKHIVVVNKGNVPFISGLHTIVAKGKTNELTHDYRRYCFQTSSIKRQFLFYAVGTKVSGVSKSNIRKILIPIPPIDEQYQIAQVLTDIDALLEVLDKTIAKKRDLKQAVMQQLLTGKTRLPGFIDHWSQDNLGDVADILKGRGLSKSMIDLAGDNPCILYGELFTTYGRKIVNVVSGTRSNDGTKSVVGDVLLPGSTTTTGADLATASALLVGGVSLGGDILIVRRKSLKYDPVFLAYYLTQTKRNQISELTQGTTIHHLYGKDLKAVSLQLPSLEEQVAITRILDDIDNELLKFEQRFEKVKELKIAIMHELLTGKTRLIAEE